MKNIHLHRCKHKTVKLKLTLTLTLTLTDTVDVCVVSTVCRRLLLLQRPSLNLNANCRMLICRLF